MDDPSSLFMASSTDCIVFAIPLVTARPRFDSDVPIPPDAVFARSANPFTPPSSCTRLSFNWLNVISPDCSAAYRSFWADSPAYPNASAISYSAGPIVS